ncbi:hypothetical protein [Deinococcus kurensis]|uniref:hypothetical protein n=1 Tax=Deinococcus kurensis TaxID=2662757 RepID=UPI0012D2CCAE|nr:hypothetical protein [Deinococcus kurensis]
MKRLQLALARFHANQLDILRSEGGPMGIYEPLTRKERDQYAQLDLMATKLDSLDHDVNVVRQHNRSLQVTHSRIQTDLDRVQDALNGNLDALQRRTRTVSVSADINPGPGRDARAIRHLGRTLVQKLISENLLRLSSTGDTFTLVVNAIQPQRPTGMDAHLLDALLNLGVPEAWAVAALSRKLDALGHRPRPVHDLIKALHAEYLAAHPTPASAQASAAQVTVTLDPALDPAPHWQTMTGGTLSRAAQPLHRPKPTRAEPDLRPRGQVPTLTRPAPTHLDDTPTHLLHPLHPLHGGVPFPTADTAPPTAPRTEDGGQYVPHLHLGDARPADCAPTPEPERVSTPDATASYGDSSSGSDSGGSYGCDP